MTKLMKRMSLSYVREIRPADMTNDHLPQLLHSFTTICYVYFMLRVIETNYEYLSAVPSGCRA